MDTVGHQDDEASARERNLCGLEVQNPMRKRVFAHFLLRSIDIVIGVTSYRLLVWRLDLR